MQVPIALYLMTHAYFCFYHTLANVCLRRTSNAVPPGPMRLLALGTVVVVLSYATAFMETLTISHFPYYSFKVSHSL
jgi:cycloeucalenol cycloisomerase